jgi:hypothetical protein
MSVAGRVIACWPSAGLQLQNSRTLDPSPLPTRGRWDSLNQTSAASNCCSRSGPGKSKFSSIPPAESNTEIDVRDHSSLVTEACCHALVQPVARSQRQHGSDHRVALVAAPPPCRFATSRQTNHVKSRRSTPRPPWETPTPNRPFRTLLHRFDPLQQLFPADTAASQISRRDVNHQLAQNRQAPGGTRQNGRAPVRVLLTA